MRLESAHAGLITGYNNNIMTPTKAIPPRAREGGW